jgi:hypothetical protein
MEPDLGSAIEPNANRRPRRATRFNTGSAMSSTRRPRGGGNTNAIVCEARRAPIGTAQALRDLTGRHLCVIRK